MEEQKELERNLEILDVTLVFLILIVLAILLSLRSALLQREQLRLTLEGEDPGRVPDPIPLRQSGSAISVGCLGFFLCLALWTLSQARTTGDPATVRSAQVNVWASLLVLLAAILRLVDLQTVDRERQTPLLEETTLPD